MTVDEVIFAGIVIMLMLTLVNVGLAGLVLKCLTEIYKVRELIGRK